MTAPVCCETMGRALAAPNPSLDRDGAEMFLVVGRSKTAEGKIMDLSASIAFCPFCGARIDGK